MILNPYDATAVRGYRLDKIERGLKEAMIRGNLTNVQQGPERVLTPMPSGVLELNNLDSTEVTPQFYHPFVLKNDTLVIDTRPFYGKATPSQASKVKNVFDYKLALIRAGLTATGYREDDHRSLYNSSELPMFIFVNWVAENLARRLGLDPEQQMKTTVVAAYYYYCMHVEEQELDEKTAVKVATKIASITRIPVSVSMDIAKELSYMQSLEDLITMLKRVVDTPRLDELNIGSSITMLAASAGWRGVQAREIVAVALEHAPTWHTIIIMAIEERSVSTTNLAKTLKFYRGRADASTYVRLVLSLMRDN